MLRNCHQCQSAFEVTDADLAFYDKASPIFHGRKEVIPPPTLCPDCREQRRFVWRNERNLHHRTCSATGSPVISVHPAQVPFPVFKHEYWWSEAFDPLAFGRPFDFSRPFFTQFRALLDVVPRINLSNSHNENCEYVNYTNYSKDCFLIYGIHASEKCCYCWRVHDCLSCFDCAQLYDCQFCSDCLDCDRCYNLYSSRNCMNCSDSRHLYRCRSCKDCLYCANLVSKQYCIFNRQRSPEEYAEEKLSLERDRREAERKFDALLASMPREALSNVQCEDCTGDYLISCKDCVDTFSAKDCRDCTRLFLGEQTHDCVDCFITGWPAEWCYEGISTCVNAHGNLFSSLCWECSDIAYCESCFHSKNLFGCTGMKKNECCVLNTQYTRDEYERLAPKIIGHMRETGEWGEFFPVTLSTFAYNETVAQEYIPLSKEEILKRGWRWQDKKDDLPNVAKKMKASELPNSIDDVPDDIVNWAIQCEATGRPFKIIRQELEFYREMKLPLPRLHPDERHRRRMALRNPRKLWDRTCAKCKKPISTSYQPSRPERVLCEECYLREVY